MHREILAMFSIIVKLKNQIIITHDWYYRSKLYCVLINLFMSSHNEQSKNLNLMSRLLIILYRFY